MFTPQVTEQPWLVFGKVSRLVAMQLPQTTSSGTPSYITIYGIHSRAVSGLTALPSNQYLSCALDGSVQTFKLNQLSHDSHVTPTPVTMETVSDESSAHGVVSSNHGLYIAVLTRYVAVHTV